MSIRVGINGFGRIGRLVFRAALGRQDLEVVSLNDLSDTQTLAHLLQYDSIHGKLENEISAGDGKIVIDGREIKVSQQRDPKQLPWGDDGVDVVIESTGLFTNREAAAAHLVAGAKKVIISAPAKDVDGTFVPGVNDDQYDPATQHVISNASCTTNCLAPVAFILDREFGLLHGLMTTIHSYTNDQPVQDFIHTDLRRARAAAVSMIPTSTGAAAAIGLVLPNLKGKLDGLAIRVPTPNVSIVDLTARLAKKTSPDEINERFKAASEEERFKGILGFSDLPLVSADYNHCAYSSIIDGLSTKAVDGDFVKVLSWYDNEWGYSNRVVDLAHRVGSNL